MNNIKTFENFNRDADEEMKELISRATKFEQEMKKRPKFISKIKMGDTVCIGKVNKAKGSRTYDLFNGTYYRCIGVNPVTLQEDNKSSKRILSDEEYNKASNDSINHLWLIDK